MALSFGTSFEVDADGSADVDSDTLDSSNSIVVYHGNGFDRHARIVQSDETVGAQYDFSTIGNSGAQTIAVGALSATKAVSIRRDTNGVQALVLSVSGTTITSPGSDVDLGGGGSAEGMSVIGLSTTEAITVFKDDTSSGRGQANYLSISGTTITDEDSVIFEAGNILALTDLVFLSSTKAIVAFIDNDDSDQLKAVTLTIAGGAISAGSPTTIDGGDECGYPGLAAINSTTCLLTYRNTTDGDIKSCVLSSPSTTITAGTLLTITTNDGLFTAVTGFSTTVFVACWENISDSTGKAQQLTVSGTTVSLEGSVQQFDANSDFAISTNAFDGTTAIVFYHATTDAVIISLLTTGTHLWLSTDGGATYTDIGDSAAWGSDVVGGVVVVPGTAYQTIFAAVGTDLRKTVNGGTVWTLETAIGYEVDFIDLEKDNTTVFLAKRDAAGTNRASLWDGAVLTHINTGKSTTGGATSGGDVV